MESGKLAIRSRKLGNLGSFGVDELLDELADCVVGMKEMESGKLAIRSRKLSNLGSFGA